MPAAARRGLEASTRTAASRYFKAGQRPTIAETVAYYRERRIGLVMFTVDSEHEMGVRRIPNQEVIDAARENSDIMVAFASIDPHKGKLGVREARELIADGGIRGFKFHPTCQGFFPNDRIAYRAVRGHRRAQAAGDLPQRTLGHRHRHAGRRRTAAQVFEPDPPRRRRGGFSRT